MGPCTCLGSISPPQGPWDPTWEALSEGLKSPPKLKIQSQQGLPLPDLQQPVTKSAPPTALTRPVPIPSSPRGLSSALMISRLASSHSYPTALPAVSGTPTGPHTTARMIFLNPCRFPTAHEMALSQPTNSLLISRLTTCCSSPCTLAPAKLDSNLRAASSTSVCYDMLFPVFLQSP